MPSALGRVRTGRREIARAHGGALHGQRRQHVAVDSGGQRQGLPPFSDAPAARGSQGSTAGRQQSLERGGQYRRRPLRERIEPAHLHHHHQDAGRGHQHPRTFDGSGGGAARGRRDAAAFARTGDRARIHGRGCERRLHAGVRVPHRLERSDDSAGAGDQPAVGVRAPVPGGVVPPAIRRSRTRCCSTACSNNPRQMRSKLGAADQARIDEYLSIVRSLETRMERASDPKRTWKPLVSARFGAGAGRETRRAIRSTSA